MAAHAVGADQVQGADRIERRLVERIGVERGLRCCGVAVGARRQPPRPGRPGALGLQCRRIVADPGEEPPPARVDRIRVIEKARVQLGNELGIAAGQERVCVSFGHQETLHHPLIVIPAKGGTHLCHGYRLSPV